MNTIDARETFIFRLPTISAEVNNSHSPVFIVIYSILILAVILTGSVSALGSGGRAPSGARTWAIRSASDLPHWEQAVRLKVCQIAGPGIPIETLFTFTVTGIGALSAAPPEQTAYGTVTRTFDVRAGDPAQGGTCEFVPGVGADAPGYDQFQIFLVGTPVTVVQVGISPNNNIPQNPGQLRTSVIRPFGASFANAGIGDIYPNPDLSPAPGRVSRATIIVESQMPQIDFASLRFNPTTLKICSIGVGQAAGQVFSFSVEPTSPQIGGVNPGPMFPAFSQNVTVTAGPDNGQGGNCTFVNGSALPGGAFNQGSTITITEAAGNVTAIGSLSSGPGGLTVDLPNRRATLSGPNGLVAGVNSVIFTNSPMICRADGGPVQKDPGQHTAVACINSVRFDFDGDAKADPAVFSPTTGQWSVAASANAETRTGEFGMAGDKPVAADYDGDGKTDVAVWRPSNGRWYFQGSTNVFEYHQWGEAGDIPLTGDYNGDGRADFIIFRPNNGTWYIKTTNHQFAIFQFGIPTDKPYTADYDGDGRTDASVFRNGTWYSLESYRGFRIRNFGVSGDIPVPADYDGDGAADYAVFRRSNGNWYILTDHTYTVQQHGASGDVPVPADFDGDGKTDIAFYRPGEGKWYIRRSSAEPTQAVVTLGSPGDIAAQSPYWVTWPF